MSENDKPGEGQGGPGWGKIYLTYEKTKSIEEQINELRQRVEDLEKRLALSML